MLQSIKRAHRLDAAHHHLHDCLLRFQGWLDDNLASLNPAVAAVITKEIEPVTYTICIYLLFKLSVFQLRKIVLTTLYFTLLA